MIRTGRIAFFHDIGAFPKVPPLSLFEASLAERSAFAWLAPGLKGAESLKSVDV